MTTRRLYGFALTEVLVAAAVLAIGLLGQLALLVAGLRTERAAADLATAATLAADLGERIRANPAAALLYAVDPGDEPPPAVVCGLATAFDAVVRAACDLDEWRREAAAALPGPQLQVNTAAVAGTTATFCEIALRWEGEEPHGNEYTLQMQVAR